MRGSVARRLISGAKGRVGEEAVWEDTRGATGTREGAGAIVCRGGGGFGRIVLTFDFESIVDSRTVLGFLPRGIGVD